MSVLYTRNGVIKGAIWGVYFMLGCLEALRYGASVMALSVVEEQT